ALAAMGLPEAHPNRLLVQTNLIVACQLAGRYDRMTELASTHLRALKDLPPEHPEVVGVKVYYGMGLLAQKKFAEAEKVLAECLAVREKTLPGHWTTFNTKSMLGAALLGQKKYTEAEPLLLAGYEGLKQRAVTIPPLARPRLTEALERLVQLYS